MKFAKQTYKIKLTLFCVIYTVGHKKRATLFGIITPMFHGRFLHFFAPMETGKNTLSENYKICIFTTIVYLHYLRKFLKHTQQKPTVSVFSSTPSTARTSPSELF